MAKSITLNKKGFLLHKLRNAFMAMLLEMGASTILYFKAEASYILQTLTAFVPYHKGTATTLGVSNWVISI